MVLIRIMTGFRLATAWIRIRDLVKCLDLDPESKNPNPKHWEKCPAAFFTEMLFEVPALRRKKCAGNNVLTTCIAQKKNPRITRKGGGGGLCAPPLGFMSRTWARAH